MLILIIYIKLIFLFNYGKSYNISPKPNYIISQPIIAYTKQPNENSYFGYRIAFWNKKIIISSPYADSTFSKRSGLVFECDIEDNGKCNPFYIDQKDSNVPESYMSKQIYDNQFLGSSLDSNSSLLTVCSPNIITVLQIKKSIEYNLNGACYFFGTEHLNQYINISYSPLRKKNDQRFYDYIEKRNRQHFSMSQLGFSVHISENNEEIVMGAPGVFEWSGAVARFQLFKMFDKNYNGEMINPFDFGGYATESYFGYSVTSGFFKHLYYNILYVASMPHGFSQKGEVVIFDFLKDKYNKETTSRRMVVYKKIYGFQMGEYFGYSLLAENINNDQLTDLIISAPFHSHNKEHYDNGKVYVYINLKNSEITFANPIILTSKYPMSGRFGMTMVKLGDINHDGCNDFAIAAPMEGNGVVYIYLGNEESISEIPSQKIESPLDNYFPPGIPHYFGYGISNAYDIDNNGFNDIAIGAPKINKVYIFRSYPTITMHPDLQPYTKTLSNDRKFTKLKACIRYVTKHPLKFDVNIKVTLKLDQNMINKRLLFQSVKQNILMREYILPSTDNMCEDFDIIVKYEFPHEPILIEMEYELIKHNSMNNSKFCEDCVIDNPNKIRYTNTKIFFISGCKNTQCESDLSITSKLDNSLTSYTLGSSKNISIEYTITNFGENAYGLNLIVDIITESATFQRVPTYCTQKFNNLYCSPTNERVFKQNDVVTVELIINTARLEGKELSIHALVNSSSIEKNEKNNFVINTIPLHQRSDIEVNGESSVSEIALEETDTFSYKIIHQFDLQNHGPSNIPKLLFIVSLPMVYINVNTSQSYNIVDENSINAYGIYDDAEIKPINGEKIILKNKLNNYFNYHSNFFNIPINRSIFFTCSDIINIQNSHCKNITFELTRFLAGDKIASIFIEFTVDLNKIEKIYSTKRDILLFMTKSYVSLPSDEPNEHIHVGIVNPHTVITKYVLEKTPLWIIIVSIIVGILVFVLISFGLYKTGFFRRKKKEELIREIRKSMIPADALRQLNFEDYHDYNDSDE